MWRKNLEKLNMNEGLDRLIKIDVENRDKKLRHEIVKHLILLSSKAINISTWWIPIKMKELYEYWLLTKDRLESRLYIMKMYYLLCQKKKLYILDDYKYVFKKLEFNENCTDIITTIIELLDNKNDQVYMWLYKIQDNKIYNKLWEQLELYFTDELKRKTITSLHYFWKLFKQKEDKEYFISNAIMLILKRDEINWLSDNLPPFIDIREIINIDSKYMDIGNKKEKTRLEEILLIDEGEENMRFINEKYRTLRINESLVQFHHL